MLTPRLAGEGLFMLLKFRLRLVLFMLFAQACGPKSEKGLKGPELTTANVVTSDDADSKRSIGDGVHQFEVGGIKALESSQDNVSATSTEGEKVIAQSLDPNHTVAEIRDFPLPKATQPPPPPKESTPSDSLLLGYPKQLLGEGQIFGAVITKISSRDSESLGGLKLTELEPRHVRPKVVKEASGNYALVLYGCEQSCNELSMQYRLQAIPIESVSVDGKTFYLDLGFLGRTLSLLDIIDPDGGSTSNLKQKYSKATYADYSSSTLVFDIESHFIPKDKDPGAENVPETVITVRWYLKLESGLNTAFEARLPTDGVGYFTTGRNATVRIVRHSLTKFASEQAPVFYFLKNVPPEQQAPFQNALEQWNAAFKEVVGRDVIGYKVATEDEAKLLRTGDVRYNILEWDLENIAPYGGIGPIIASQNTGEIFSSNILVQGPTINRQYKEWFRIQAEVKDLRAEGRNLEADTLLRDFKRQLKAREHRLTPKAKVIVDGKKMVNPADDPRLMDQAMARMDFYDTPEGETYDSYMQAYWQELVAHETGHNFGLRHNFRGNLGADDEDRVQSWSVMEYLSRPYRHKNKIGDYDKMALAYGYTGKKPTRLDMYCTDEDVSSYLEIMNSAECSREDATNDPFSAYLSNLRRIFDLGIGRGTPYAPSWTPEDLSGELTKSLGGAAVYATSAATTGAKWTNWKRPGRPTELEKIPAYVVEMIRVKLCDPSMEVVIRGKEDETARAKAFSNLAALRTQANSILTSMNIKDKFSCDAATP